MGGGGVDKILSSCIGKSEIFQRKELGRALIKLHCFCEHELVGISTKFYNFRVKDNIFVETPIRLALKTIART